MNSKIQVILLSLALLLLAQIKALSSSDCVPGEIYEGPTCSTFTKCTEGPPINKKVTFDCPPGTYFHKKHRICDHDFHSRCPTSGPKPPSPFISGGSPEGVPPTVTAGPPGVLPPAPQFPPQPAEVECPTYEVDLSGVYDCPEPGFFPSYGDCHTFYRCINSMGCIVKGFYVSCPLNYLFNDQWENCTLEELTGPCTKVQDAASSPKISPVIELTVENMKKFFASQAYWNFMSFLPKGTQRITYPDGRPFDISKHSERISLNKDKTKVNW